MTKEEKYILKAFELQNGDAPQSKYKIGEALSFRPKNSEHIARNLMQMNFFKKIDDEHILLTDLGSELAKTLSL